MTPKLLLEQSYNKTAFSLELLVSAMIVFFIFIAAYLFKNVTKTKSLTLTSLTYSLIYMFAVTIGWAFSRFLSTSASWYSFGTPPVVIIQAIFQGVTKNFDGPILSAGIWYILGAQFLGALIGIIGGFLFAGFSYIYFLNKNCGSRLNIDNYLLSWKNNWILFTKTLEETYTPPKQKVWKFAVKENFFILLLIATIPFFSYINVAFFQTSVIWNFILALVGIFILLLLSQHFGYFMFNFFLTTIIYLMLICLLIFQPKKIQTIAINFGIQFSATLIWSFVIGYVGIYLANQNQISFNL